MILTSLSLPFTFRVVKHLLSFVCVVNGFPLCGILFRFGRKNKIRKEYLGTGF